MERYTEKNRDRCEMCCSSVDGVCVEGWLTCDIRETYELLAAIEDILGDTYDLSRLRELLEVCKGKTPDQVAGIFEEWSHYLKFSAEKNAIEGALNSIYQGGEVDYGRLRELVEADREGRCVVLPCKKGEPRQMKEKLLTISGS